MKHSTFRIVRATKVQYVTSKDETNIFYTEENHKGTTVEKILTVNGKYGHDKTASEIEMFVLEKTRLPKVKP